MSDKWVRVMPDYSSSGLWERGGANISVGSVPISAETAWDLGAWQCQYDLLCEDYLPEERRTTPFDAASHARWGRQIAEAIKAEPPDWTVVYFDHNLCRYDDSQPRSEFEFEVSPSPERSETR